MAMHANMSSPAKEKDAGEIAVDLYPFIRDYMDSSVEQLLSMVARGASHVL
jgi:hypothetical protein